MANEVARFIRNPSIQQRIEELKLRPEFTTSVLAMINSVPKLGECKPETVFNAALTAASLNLPVNNNLGFAYIIPYSNHGVMEAQFQMGWRGFVQLGQRTGQYKKIGATQVFEGQLKEENPLYGNTFDWKAKTSDKVIGYVSGFQLVTGFEKQLYMDADTMEAHAARYSQSYKYDLKDHKTSSLWSTDREKMGLKTVIKLVISRFGPMSIEIQKAVDLDQAILRDSGPVYIDNDLDNVGADDEKKQAIIAAHGDKNGNPGTPRTTK